MKSQCTVCNAVFRTVKGFDRHRVGVPGDRRCLTSSQMVETGFRLRPDGVWLTGASPKDMERLERNLKA